MNRIARWGILGTGNIARQFCTGVSKSKRGTLAAVGSRQPAGAQGFAGEFRIPRFGDYESVLSDPTVDAVYIALPNALHHPWTLKALQHGKHVLCEKPLAMGREQAGEMFQAAEKAGRVLMEAFMYRTHPLTRAVLESVRRGDIGEVRLIRSSFCFRTHRVEGNIRFDRALGGGALMDVGCYCVNFSRLLAGAEPEAIHVAGRLHPSGVDEVTAGTLQFPGGVLASFTCGLSVQADNSAYICGSDGYIEIPVPWKPPARQASFAIAHNFPPKMDLAGRKAPPAPPARQTHTVDAETDLYGLEADEFVRTIFDGAAPTITAQDSMGNAGVLEEMRRQLGVAEA